MAVMKRGFGAFIDIGRVVMMAVFYSVAS